MNTWLVEVPQGQDPYADYIKLAQTKTKSTEVKNKKQQLKNQAGGNLLQVEKKAKLESQLRITKSSTASLGKFDAVLKNDVKAQKGKRKASSLMNSDEGERSRKLADKVMNVGGSSYSKKQKPVEINKRKAISMASHKRSSTRK